METSKIQWTDATVNFWTGCKKVSEGCKYCYMYRDQERYGKDPTTVIRTQDATFKAALKWEEPKKIFTCSWSDFFIENADKWRDDAWDVIRKTPQHQWLILTKRPERIMQCLPSDWGDGWDNVWLGVTIENQKNIGRAETLSKVPAKIRFISAEPIIDEIDFSLIPEVLKHFHWCIVGGESGNETGKYLYRPCPLNWITKIVEDLKKLELRIFIKQTGTWLSKKLGLKDSHGGSLEEWPESIQIREFPAYKTAVSSPLLDETMRDNLPGIPTNNSDTEHEISVNEDIGISDPLRVSPLIPEDVYENLPSLLKQVTLRFSDPREKDVILTGSLVILGGCFSGIRGMYSTEWYHPNLFGFVVAPPANGKGKMSYAKKLGDNIQKKMESENAENRLKLSNLSRSQKAIIDQPIESNPTPLVKPKYPVLFIPGNSSSASIYKLLNESNGRAIICEAEADSMTGAIKQEWGNFSHILRNSFQHETISMSRAGNDLYLSVERPCLSVLLSGTPDQVPKLIGSTEDGLFSRFIFYAYSRSLEWIDPTPNKADKGLEVFFNKYSEHVRHIKNYLDDGGYTFSLTAEQFERLNINFRKKVSHIKLFNETDVASAVYRLGLITFRIAMILSVLNEEEIMRTKDLQCSDNNLYIALQLADIYFEHSLIMYSSLPKRSRNNNNPKMREFYTFLPLKEDFKRKKANEIGKDIGISEKSVHNYLTKFTKEGLLESPEYGIYRKKPDL